MLKLSRCTCFHVCMQAYISVYFISMYVCMKVRRWYLASEGSLFLRTETTRSIYPKESTIHTRTYTKTNLRYSQVRSTMHVVYIYAYTDIPRWHRWTCSKKGSPTQISLYKLICTLPPVPSTTSSTLQRVCYCIDYFVCIYCMCMYCTYAFEFIYVHACMCECMLGSA